MEDKTIVCVDCGEPFVFSAGEQQFYAERGLTEIPKRCKPCRTARRRSLRRRRQGRGEAPTAAVVLPRAESEAVAGVEDEASATPAKSNGNGASAGQDRVANGPTTFWEERPQWVRDAMMKAAALDEGGAGDNGKSPVNGAAESGDARRKRRRRQRRKGRRDGAVELVVKPGDVSAEIDGPAVQDGKSDSEAV